jgi:hypothetical protein
VLAHAEIVVRAPYNDISGAVRAVPECIGELSYLALKVSEDAIPLLMFQSGNGRFKGPVIIDIGEHFLESSIWVLRLGLLVDIASPLFCG